MSSLEQMREGWDEFARAYDGAITPLSTQLAEDALNLVGVQSGTRLLDIAAGGGALSIPAAQRGAEVLAVDFSPEMVGLLREKANDLGLKNLTAREMDGTALELEDNSFDVVCSQLGVMLFPERDKGLREMARVTSPGGKAVMVAFAPPERVQFISIFFRALREVLPDLSPSGSPLFSLGDPDTLRREMEEAGFRDVRVEPRSHWFEIDTVDQFWSTMESAAPVIAGLLSQLSEEQLATARSSLASILRTEYGEGSVRLSAEVNVGIGLK